MEFTKKITLLFFLVIVLSGTNTQVHAQNITQQIQISSSPNPVGSGARAIGMGGAFIAIADDATAASWNPGGLIQLETPEVSMVGSYFTRSEDFSSDAEGYPLGGSNSDSFDFNYLSAVYPFAVFNRNMVVSLNFQRLYDFNRNLDFTSSYEGQYNPVMSYGMTQNVKYGQSGGLSAISPAYCVQATPQLSFGLTLNFWTDAFFKNGWTESYQAQGSGHLTIGETSYDYTTGTNIHEKYSSPWGVNANVGFLWDITPMITIGGVFKSPFTLNMKHQYESSFFQHYTDPAIPAESGTHSYSEDVEIDFPMSYGLGIAFRFSDALTCSLDVYRTEWGGFAYKDGKGRKTSPIDGRSISDSDVGPTHQVRLGGEYVLIFENTMVPLRCGLFYDPEPGENGSRDFYGFSLGAGVTLGPIVFDAAYQFRFGNNIKGEILTYPGATADIQQHKILVSAIYHF